MKLNAWNISMPVGLGLLMAGLAQAEMARPQEAARSVVKLPGAKTPVTPEIVVESPVAPIVSDRGSAELIKERYPSGGVKIEREVMQDAQENYLNHGRWKQFDEQGVVVAEGRYENAVRVGTWMRLHRRTDFPALSEANLHEFQEPFISQATFKEGRLDGKWVISDSKQRRILEIEFADGQRHGVATWWFANGQKRSVSTYEHGIIDGELNRWDAAGKTLGKQTYQKGREVVQFSTQHPNGNKKDEGVYLAPKREVKTTDAWWDVKFATYTDEGQKEKHGLWTSWHANNQLQVRGKYEYNLPVGDFSWFYPNGQKALAGTYEQGKSTGTWIWWHDNGQKKVRGEYADGHPTGQWAYWSVDGKLSKREVMSNVPVSEDKSDIPSSTMLNRFNGPALR